jgi:hypothetical protein
MFVFILSKSLSDKIALPGLEAGCNQQWRESKICWWKGTTVTGMLGSGLCLLRIVRYLVLPAIPARVLFFCD